MKNKIHAYYLVNLVFDHSASEPQKNQWTRRNAIKSTNNGLFLSFAHNLYNTAMHRWWNFSSWIGTANSPCKRCRQIRDFANNSHEFTLLRHLQFLQRILLVTLGVMFISDIDNYWMLVANYTQRGGTVARVVQGALINRYTYLMCLLIWLLLLPTIKIWILVFVIF